MGLREGNEFTDDIRVIFCSLIGYAVFFSVAVSLQLGFSNPYPRLSLAVVQIACAVLINMLFGRFGFGLSTIMSVLQLGIMTFDFTRTQDRTTLAIVFIAAASIIVTLGLQFFMGKVYSRMFRVKKLYNQARSQLITATEKNSQEVKKETSNIDRNIVKHDKNGISNLDPLTVLPNRYKVLEEVENWIDDKISLMQSGGGINKSLDENITIIYLDIENYNDILFRLGHHPTDLFIQNLAHKLREEAHPHDLLGRVAAGEFVIAAKRSLSRDALMSYVSALTSTIKRSFAYGGEKISVRVCAGCSSFPQDARFSGDLLGCAEYALVSGARLSENKDSVALYSEIKDPRFKVHGTSLSKDLIVKMEQLIPQAIKNEEVYVVYQPQYNIEGTLMGFEAFLRWKNPELGTLSAIDFMQVAEKTGTIYDLGHFSVRCAIETLAKINATDPKLKMTVNISSSELKNGDIPGLLADLIGKYRIDPSNLIVDIPEECLTTSFDMVRPAINYIASLGVYMTLDNFGRGYSSLNNIPLLPVKGIKLDSNFTRNVGFGDEQMGILTASIIDQMHEIDVYVCATGVGSKELFHKLRDYCCDFYQGGFLSKPVRADELDEIIKTAKVPSRVWTQEAP